MYTTRLDIPHHIAKQAAGLLQARLSDALELHSQLKQAHWNVRGRDFSQLHELFDRLAGEVEAFADDLAERITTLGHPADGRTATTARETGLNAYALGVHSGDDHLKAIAASVGQFAKALRSDVSVAGEFGDPGSADVLTQISRAADKQLWIVEAHLLPE